MTGTSQSKKKITSFNNKVCLSKLDLTSYIPNQNLFYIISKPYVIYKIFLILGRSWVLEKDMH